MKVGLGIEILASLAFLVVATVIISLSGADLATSSLFYISNAWPIGEQFPWKMLYKIDRTPAVIMAFLGLVAAIRGLRNVRMRHWVRPGFFLVIMLIIGPGLLVNSVFKEHWGRPRPREVIQLGGDKLFKEPWQAQFGVKGRSFPSGHSSAAFYLIAPFFIYRRSKPKLAYKWLAGGIVFGCFMSYARIAQGGHFLSDCLWSLGMVWLTGLVIAEVMKIYDRQMLPAPE